MARTGTSEEPRDCIAAARLRLSRYLLSGISSRNRSLTAGRAWWLYAIAVSLLSPVALSAAFPPFHFGLVSLVALAPLFLLWSQMSWKQAFWSGWLSGTLLYILLFYWMANTIFDFVGSWSILVVTLVCGTEALAVAAVAVVASLVGRGAFRTMSIFALPAAWLLFESARSQGTLAMPFGMLGHVAAHLPWLLPLAACGGTYLLTAVIALANGALAGILAGPGVTRNASIEVVAGLVVLVATVSAIRNHVAYPSPDLRVAIAQGNIAQRVKWTPATFAHALATYSDLTRRAAAGGAKVVVWPETAITSYPLQDHALLSDLEALSMKTHVWVIAGALDAPSAQRQYNSMLDMTPGGSVGGVYHKHWLVPFAEYLPFERLLRRIPFMDGASDFRAGPGPHALGAGGLLWGALICYESAFASYARAPANAGADAIIMAADDAWFEGSKEPYEHADMAVIEAVSTGRWIARSTQSGISEFVDPKGHIVAQLGLDQQGLVFSTIGRGMETPFDRFGVAWLVVLACMTVAGALLHSRRGATK